MSTASFVAGQILTAAALNDVINSKVDSTNAQIAGGQLEGIDHIYITGTNVSTNPTTGALTVVGGVGIGGDVNAGGKGTFASDVSSGGNVSGAKGTFSDFVSTQKNILGVNQANLITNSSGEFGNVGWSAAAFASALDVSGTGYWFVNSGAINAATQDSQSVKIGSNVTVTLSGEIGASGVVAGRAYLSLEAFNSLGVSLGVIATATITNGQNGFVSTSAQTPANTSYVNVNKGVDTSPNVPANGLKFRRIKFEQGSTPSLYSQEGSIAALQGNSNGELRLDVSTADVTLTPDQFSNSIFAFTGALTGNRTVTVPATNKSFIVQNLTTGTYSLTIKAAGQTPTATVLQGKASSLFSDSTGVYATSSVAGMQFAAVFSYAINTTFTITQLGAMVNMTGNGTTATLPPANTYPAGSGVAIVANPGANNAIQMATQGNDTMTFASPYALYNGDHIFMYSDGVSKWHLGWYANKINPTFDGLLTSAGYKLSSGGITFADGSVQTTATAGTAPTTTIFSLANGNFTVGASSLVTGGFTAPFVTIFKNGAKLTPVIDYTLNADGKTINFTNGYVIAATDFFEVQTGFTYNPSTVYVPASTLVTPAYGATSITTVSYTPGYVRLYRNGSRLVPTVDFTATDGTTITFIGFVGDGRTQVEVEVLTPITYADTVRASAPVLNAPLTFADGTQQGTSYSGQKNVLINGGMDISQRGVSFVAATSAPTAYTADRWMAFRAAYTAAYTVSIVNSPAFQGLGLGVQNALVFQRSNGDTSTQNMNVAYNFETNDVKAFAGRTFTLSWYSFANANLIGVSETIAVYWGTGTDSNIAVGLTNQALLISKSYVMGASGPYAGWTRNSVTFTVPATATQLSLLWSHVPSGTAGASDYFAFAGAQMELGTVATPFEVVNRNDTLVRCNRYYEVGQEPYWYQGTSASGVTVAYGDVKFRVLKRVTPTLTQSGWKYYSGGSNTSLTATLSPFTDRFNFQVTGMSNWNGWTGDGTWTANAEL